MGLKGITRLPKASQRARRNASVLGPSFGFILGDGLEIGSDGLFTVIVQDPVFADSSGIGLNYGTGLTLSGADLVLDILGLTTDTIAAGDWIPFHDLTDAPNKLTFANFEATLNHDSLSGFVANEHIDWTDASDNLLTTGNITIDSDSSGLILGDGQDATFKWANATAEVNLDTDFRLDGAFGLGVSANATLANLYTATTYSHQTGTRRGLMSYPVLAPAGALGAATILYAFSAVATWNTAVDGSARGNVYGFFGGAQTGDAASGDVSQVVGLQTLGRHYGSGTLGNLYACYAQIFNPNTYSNDGDITSAFCFRGYSLSSKSTGNITNLYGLYIDKLDGGGSVSNHYGIWIEDLSATNKNYAIVIDSDSIGLMLGDGQDMIVYYNGGGGVIDTSLVAASDLVVTCGADKTIELTNTVWRDSNIGAGTLSGPPGLQPGIANFVDEVGGDTGIATYGIAVGEGLSGSVEMPHEYKEGTDIIFHVHWQGTAAPTGTDKVKWQLTYTVSDGEATLDAVTTITVETDIDVQYEFRRSNFAAITGTNFDIEDQFLFTLQRVAASADEYGGEALLATVGIHFEVDTVGSRQIATK